MTRTEPPPLPEPKRTPRTAPRGVFALNLNRLMPWKRQGPEEPSPEPADAGGLLLPLGEDYSILNTEDTEQNHNGSSGVSRATPSLAVIALLTASLALLPTLAMADGPIGGDGRGTGEIQHNPPRPIPGRRLFIESISVTPGQLHVTLRAATPLKVVIRSMGGEDGKEVIITTGDEPLSLAQGQAFLAPLPLELNGPLPTTLFHWTDTRGEVGTLSLNRDRLPHPLPTWQTEYCDLSVTELSWHPGTVAGLVHAECRPEGDELTAIPTHEGAIEQLVQSVELPHQILTNSGQLSVKVQGVNDANPKVVNWNSVADTHFSIPVPRNLTVQPITLQLRAFTSGQVLPVSHRKNHVQVPQHTIWKEITVCPPGCTCSQQTASYLHPAYIRPDVLTVNTPPPSVVDNPWTTVRTNLFTDATYKALNLPPLPPTLQPGKLPEGMSLEQFLAQGNPTMMGTP